MKKTKNIHFYIFGVAIVSVVALIPAFAQQPPICVNSSGHLIWKNQTANYVPILDSVKDQLKNSVIYQSDNNIGIGTINPDVKLDISAGDNDGIRIGGTGDARLTFRGNSVDRFYFRTVSLDNLAVYKTGIGTPIMKWNNNGNVGIGTINPQAKLDVNGTARISGAINTGALSVTGNINATGDICTATKCLNSITSGGGGTGSFTETDPTVKSWAKTNNPTIPGNLTVSENITSSKDVKGQRLCIGNNCLASWGAISSFLTQPEQSGWEIDTFNTNTTKTSAPIKKVQIKNGSNLILEISEE